MELLRLIGAVALFFGYYSVGSAGGLPAHSDHTHSPIASECGNEPSPTADRVPKDSRQGEHSAALNLVAICSVTHTAVKSGAWTDPTTWLDGKVPVAEARVHIPNGARVTIDSDFAPAIDWVRIDGTLTWSVQHSASIVVRTIVVTDTGRLEIGTPEHAVSPNATAQLSFAPRLSRNSRLDPFDMAGGLISMGIVQIAGAQKTPIATPITRSVNGATQLSFIDGLVGWSIGDELLFAGTSALDNQDEIRRIVQISDNTVLLDEPLKYSHLTPEDISIPVGNLTRNVRIRSLVPKPLWARAHVMFMHRQTGVILKGAEFVDLGRTDTRQAHTFPEPNAAQPADFDADQNTIGRYALHFHVISGARIDVSPHVVRNNVVRRSPKHGIVNHGGHVLAEGNVTFQIDGSHFFCENGTEIGIFAANLAVRSVGSSDGIMSRSAIFDHGHQGHGFWMQSAGMRIADNWAFGHANGAYVVFGYAFKESSSGRTYFDAHNVGSPSYADAEGRIPTSDVDLYFARNRAAGSHAGVEIWNHKLLATHASQSVIEDVLVWNVKSNGVFLPYVRNTILRKIAVYAGHPHVAGDFGIGGNIQSENIIFQHVAVHGFPIGLLLPQRGINRVEDALLRNDVNIAIETANRPHRLITLQGVDLEPDAKSVGVRFADLKIPENGDVAMLFESDRIFMTDADKRNWHLFFPSQTEDFVPFKNWSAHALRGLTSAQIKRVYGLSLGGRLAPPQARHMPGTNALAALAEADALAPTALESAFSQSPSIELYPLASEHIINIDTASVESRWQLVRQQSRNTAPSFVFMKTTEPKLIIHPLLRALEIHPDDVQYGYRLYGLVVDVVERRVTQMAFIDDFYDLKANEQGRIELSSQIPDPAGKFTTIKLSLKVTDRAIRRGKNLSWFEQSKYCGKCEFYGEMLSEIRAVFPESENLGNDSVRARTLVQEMIVQAAGALAELHYVVNGQAEPSIPIGWAVMSPMIVTIGDDQYAPYFVPCDRASRMLYCVDIMKNGVPISERLAMGQTLMPAHMIGELAYHPPLLFTDGQRLLLVYWVRAQGGRSIIQLLSLNPHAPYPAPWTVLSTFEHPNNEHLSYLGGAMGPSGEIVIAGYGTAGPSGTHRLELMKILPPYTGGWMPKQVIAEYSSLAHAPEYPHVAIRGDGTISILAVLANATPCLKNGATYSAYKNVVNYLGKFGEPFVTAWSDATPDTVRDPTNRGDNCLFNAERFPLDHFWDAQSNATYSIVRNGELDELDTNQELTSNANFIRTFKLYRDDIVIVPDLAAYFSKFSNQRPCHRPVSSCRVDSMSMTRLDNGLFVFFANHRGDDPSVVLPSIGIMWSKDLKSFSEPVYLPTLYGAGYGIKVAQPNKNGLRSLSKLHFFNTGNSYNAAQLNHNHRFTYWRWTLN